MLSKDDPVYYKVQLEKLLKQAKYNGLKVVEENGRVGFISEVKIADIQIHREQASVNIKDYEATTVDEHGKKIKEKPTQIPKECYLYNSMTDECYNETNCKAKCPKIIKL